MINTSIKEKNMDKKLVQMGNIILSIISDESLTDDRKFELFCHLDKLAIQAQIMMVNDQDKETFKKNLTDMLKDLDKKL